VNPTPHCRRQRAQVIVLFALGIVGFTALLGLILDGGTAFVQRRTAQNAADAAALAGTRALQQAASSPTLTIPSEICKYVLANNFGVTPHVSAYYVDASGNKVVGSDIVLPPNCAGSVSYASIWSGVAGVHVDVTFGPYNTYVAGIVGVRQLAARASATAQVWDLAVDASYLGPWAICGPTAPTSTTPTYANIVDPVSGTIAPSAITSHVSVILQSSQMNAGVSSWEAPPPACPNASGDSWKGKINASGTIVPPMNVPTDTGNGDVTPPCAATGQPVPTGPGQCYLFVPVTDGNNSSGQAHLVTFACMDVYPGSTGLDKWWGTLQPYPLCPMYPYRPLWTWSAGTSGGQTIVALTR
jgi:hypothetical protein